MTHLLPVDELRRQFDAGEIDRDYYEAMRSTQPEPGPKKCSTPGCTREAHSIQRGRPVCAVCGIKARNARR
jgi:hypothetical protein